MKHFYLIPLSHYDVAWAFNREDYLYIYELTLKKAVEMIREKDYKFIIEQIYPLIQFEEQNPALFEDIKSEIEKGNIEIVDGLYLMPDLMLPGGETLVREILVGKLYCREKLGIDVPVAWVADSFGLNAQMPQIYKKAGYQWLGFRRGLSKMIGYRVSEFLWEGLDGSKIISHWFPMGYRAGLEIPKWEENTKRLAKYATTDHVLMPSGSGGVPPQEDIPDAVMEWNKIHPDYEIKISTPTQFFTNLEENSKHLSTFSGELYSADLEDIFPDVVSSRISLKLAIKDSENSILLTEKLSSLARIKGKEYPFVKMNELWEKMLYMANHDIMPSCGIDEIYNDVWKYIHSIKDDTRTMINESLKYLIGHSSDSSGLHILIFNPYNWEVQDWVETEIELPISFTGLPGIYYNDEEIDSQILESPADDTESNSYKIGFFAIVPQMGYRIFEIGPKKKEVPSNITITENTIITDQCKITINEKTGIIKIFDEENVNLLIGNELIVDEEMGDLYFHFNHLDQYIAAESGGGIRFGDFKLDSFEIIPGPLKTEVIVKTNFYCLRWPYYLTEKFGPLLYRHKTIEVIKRISVYRDTPRIDFYTYINLRQSHVRIRLKFDHCMVAPEYHRQTQFGTITLPQIKTQETGVSIPAPFWLCCEEGNRGLAFFTPGVPVNEVKPGEIYYTLLRSVSVLSADGISGPLIPTPGAMELGEHEYNYAIYPYNGSWKENAIYRHAFEFGSQLIVNPIAIKPENTEQKLLHIESNNIIVSSIKHAERDNAIIVRFFETRGDNCTVKMSVPDGISHVLSTNLLEDNEMGFHIEDNKIEVPVKSHEIVTLKFVFGE